MFDLNSAIIPTPQYTEDRKASIVIGKLSKANFYFDFSCGGEVMESAKGLLTDKMTEFALVPNGKKYKISLKVDDKASAFGENAKSEAYFIDINENEAVITGYDEGGAYYGAVSFASLVHMRGDLICLPECFILDYPKFSQRGHFMENRYGSDFMTLDDWKKGIDYLSEMKINTLIIGLYGCWSRQYDGDFAEYQYIPFRKYPELKTPRQIKYYSAKDKKWIYKPDVLPNMYETDYFGEMIAYGKKKNIKVIPLFNSLGHNTLIPRVFPEISAQDEDGNCSGFGFCTSNEKTYEVMFNIYDEIIDRYLTPNSIDSFEIGLDEIGPSLGVDSADYQKSTSPVCKCPKCRDREFAELLIQYIIRIAKYMKSKGINNIYVYHDMLLRYDLITEETAELFKKEGIYDNIVIDWWEYSDDKEHPNWFSGKADKVSSIFRSVGKAITGYYHWCVPSHSSDNLIPITELAEEKKFEALIAYSSFEYCYDFNYNLFAECGWNPSSAHYVKTLEKYVGQKFPECYSGVLSAIQTAHEFMKTDGNNLALYTFGYYFSSYLKKNMEYPQNFPSNKFKVISEDEEKYLKYLMETYHKSKSVYDFFKNNTS